MKEGVSQMIRMALMFAVSIVATYQTSYAQFEGGCIPDNPESVAPSRKCWYAMSDITFSKVRGLSYDPNAGDVVQIYAPDCEHFNLLVDPKGGNVFSPEMHKKHDVELDILYRALVQHQTAGTFITFSVPSSSFRATDY